MKSKTYAPLTPSPYTPRTWRSPFMLSWIINPIHAINELILGQRVPKMYWMDTSSNKPKVERTFVPCPHCHAVHDHRTWSTQNNTMFKNWFGLYCPACGNIIPCLQNGLSLVILVLTFPVWGWFRNTLKARWLQQQPARFRNLDLVNIPNPYEGKGWIKIGLSWGAFMFVAMTFIFPLLSNEAIQWRDIIIGIPIWILSGLAFGYTMLQIEGRKKPSPIS